MFQYACGAENLNENIINKVINKLKVPNDTPLILFGLMHFMTMNKPQSYWNKNVANEILHKLNFLYKENNELFIEAFINNQEHFFSAINAYTNIIDIYNELYNVSYEIDIKTKIFRNPIYCQICEDCLMNFYRSIVNIINYYSDKDYSNKNTLGEVIPILIKNNLLETSKIDTNIRNAINHGNILVLNNNEIIFKYREKGNYISKKITIWEFDDIINESLDIASGVLIGLTKFLGINKHLLMHLLTNNNEEELCFEWIKLFYGTQNTRILFFDKSIVGSSQLNVHIKTSITNQNSLIIAIIEILKGVYIFFPQFKRYFCGYQHNRSIIGYIRLSNEDFEDFSNIDNSKLYLKAINNKDALIWDIQNHEVDERAYKYNIFPIIKGAYWEVIDIEDCSVEKYKRINAKLIFDKNAHHENIKNTIMEVIDRLIKIKTPQNPRTDIPYGNAQSNMIFLNVFYESTKRRTFDLLPQNQFFICMAHYYDQDNSPRLDHGGIPEFLWEKLRKEKYEKTNFAWNPNYKKP